MEGKQVNLINTQTGKHEPFAADHAERLLKYPGSVYKAVESEKAPKVTVDEVKLPAKDADAKAKQD